MFTEACAPQPCTVYSRCLVDSGGCLMRDLFSPCCVHHAGCDSTRSAGCTLSVVTARQADGRPRAKRHSGTAAQRQSGIHVLSGVLQIKNTVTAYQQTCGVPTLVYCWTSVVDGGPTVNQRCVGVSCLLEIGFAQHRNGPATRQP